MTTPFGGNSSVSYHHTKLACIACQRKKIKCDRNFPCGQCERSSLQCAPSQRKPRARHATAKRNGDVELRSRIAKLENLVSSLSNEVSTSGDSSKEALGASPPEGIPSPNVDKYIGSPQFWSSLVGDVQALREALDDHDPSDDERDQPMPASTDPGNGMDYDLLILPPHSIHVMPGALLDPPPQVANQLYDIFLQNVDRVFHVPHRPTLRAFFYDRHTYMGQEANSPANRALKAAAWFAAVTTLSEADCHMRFRASRNDLLHTYRRHVDVALVQADLINTVDIATLQAFAIYNAAARIMDVSRRTWTTTALLVRIARAMRLDHEAANASALEKETKRRLWHSIRLLDIYGAIDRGTEPLVPANSFTTPLPSNLNDEELEESATEIPHHETGITDNTFALMAYLATEVSMRFLIPETHGSKGDPWQVRLELALNLGKVLRERFLQYCDMSKPFHRFLHAVGNSMAASTVLRAVRPLQRHVSSIPPRVDSTFVLNIAIDCLRANEGTHADPEAAGWRWIFWTQWHGIAVALAGLCSTKDDDLAQKAWPLVERAFERSSKHVADSKHGMLWRPIEKLYRKAVAIREGKSPHSTSTSPFDVADLAASNAISNAPPALAAPPPRTQPIDPQLLNAPAQALPTQDWSNFAMDFEMDDGLNERQGDFTWMDWERIMEDIQTADFGGRQFAGLMG